jgi:hypothetical protein
MTSTINASSTGSGGIVQTADASGVLALQTNGTTAVTISTGQVVTFAQQPAGTFAGTGPAFSATMSANQNITSSVGTLLNFNTKEYDTNTCFNNTGSTVTLNGVSVPAYAFGPNVAGYYQVFVSLYPNTSTSFAASSIYKSGGIYKSIQTTGTNVGVELSCIVYLNGTSDYVQFYGYLTGTTPQVYSASVYTFFQAAMVRAA